MRRGSAVLACLFGWLLPGAGHFYLGRIRRGLFFLAAISALFLLGLAMNAKLDVYLRFDDLMALIVSLGQMATGLVFGVAKALGYGAGRPTAPMFEYGVTFTATAGLLNILILLDAHDIAQGRKP